LNNSNKSFSKKIPRRPADAFYVSMLIPFMYSCAAQWADAYRQGVPMAGQSGTQIVESAFSVLKEHGLRAKVRLDHTARTF